MKKLMFMSDWKQHPTQKDILVSDDGRILSYKKGEYKELKQSDNGCGYYRVGVGHGNPMYVHRLVAETYIENPEPEVRTQVNHKDGNKKNNTISNLEWVSPSENNLHAFSSGLKHSYGTKIRIVETGEIFDSEAECARKIDGIQGNIAQCLSKKRKTHRGYHFERI